MAGASPHILSGLGKDWSPPSFAKDEPRPKWRPTLSSPLHFHFPPAGQHPDEEKGRSIRSTQRTMIVDSPNMFSTTIGLAPAIDLSNGTELNDGDDFVDAWAADGGNLDVDGEEEDEITLVSEFDGFKLKEESSPRKTSEEIWAEALTYAVDHANGTISLAQKQLKIVPDSISELSHLVKISAFSSRALDRPVRSVPDMFLNRSPSSTSKPPLPKAKSPGFNRSSTMMASPTSRQLVNTTVPLEINLAVNDLVADSLSNALFGLENLKCLWLRLNKLERLPPSIGRLSNLVDLSLSTNQLEYLPAEILRLSNLATLTLHPNPFLTPPSPSSPRPSIVKAESSQQATSSRVLGPLTTHFNLPSLREIALRKLLESDPATPSQRLIQREDSTWVRENLPAHDYAAFASIFPSPLNLSHSSSTRSRHSSHNSSSDPLDFTRSLPPQPFDPLGNVCCSPLHPDEEKVFFSPAVERFEWVEERLLKPRANDLKPEARTGGGPKTIPIKWRGCSARCLDWLEEEEEDVEAEEEEK